MKEPAKAFLFDLNGTMINDMEYHVHTWRDMLNNDLQADLSYLQVKAQMFGKNQEVLKRIFGADKFTETELDAISIEKEKRYQRRYLPELALIPGLEDFLQAAQKAGIKMGIGTAAIPFNVDFVLDNLNIREYFDAIVSANDVHESKPHPETFLKAASLLRVEPANCIVFEDAPKGVESAMRAGMRTIVITTMHGNEEFYGFTNVIGFIEDYRDRKLGQLLVKSEY